MPEPEGLSVRPYRLDAYERLWDRLLIRLNEGKLNAATQAVVELGLLLAVGLYRIERAVGTASDQACYENYVNGGTP